MPQVAQFRGIAVRINFADHPPPHLHAFYGGRQVLVEIATGMALRGSLPPAQMQRLLDWMDDHRTELIDAWNLASAQVHPPWIAAP